MTSFREWQLDTHQLGRRVLIYDSINSTSTRCAEFAADQRNHGLAVLAHAQDAGRGQHGRRWRCEPGDGVLLSVLLFPPRALSRPVILTAWVAVSVCELIHEITGLETRIKWPNDVLIDGRKVCGILIEQNRGVVAGIGLNLNQTHDRFLDAGLPEAASLRVCTGQSYDVQETARQLIRRLDHEYCRLTEGDIPSLEERWRSRLALRRELVEVEGHGGNYRGLLRELSFDAVVLELPDGEPLVLAPEQIKHITADSASGAA